ncbi:uncharacterized protein PV09_04223 [Verruconis gallopava]|uniref:FAD-binding domain-containing protein n=1 Tax=Verruconis gallopava TaxID=253628 RepID=A0A0D2B179_9PEZI|nr:uncharacterized protein PV09_04223 [Verruconis gallopava]KIW05069.1 hypothetical protein PV09_04223 [Verruconis gallopava]
MEQKKRAIIIGGGPAGLLAALRLTQHNDMATIVYEIRPEPTTLGGAIGIPSNGLRLLARLGLYDALLERGCLTPEIVMHSLDGSELGKLAMVSWSEQKTGFGYLRIQRTAVMDVLLEAASKAGIPVVFGKSIKAIDEDDISVTATFSDGTSDSADFMIGADGIHSAVRRLYIDPSITPKYTGIANLYALVSTKSLRKEASELRNLNPTLTEDGLFAISPCTPDGQLLYWFFSRELPPPATGDDRDGWEHRGKEEVDSVKATVLGLLGQSQSKWTIMLKDIVKSTDTVRFYPVYHIPPGVMWHRGRCLLIGDAAHAMPPHASQGVSMASEDVIMLSKLLRDFSHLPYTRIFERYEEKRRPRTEKFLTTAQRNGTVRKKVSPIKLRFYEYAVWAALGLYRMSGIGKLGINQKDLVYDPEDEAF